MNQTEHQKLAAQARFAKAHNVACLPLIRAALARHILLIALHDSAQPWPAVQVALAKGHPAIILICDDPEPVKPSVGPHGWAAAASLRHWPAHAVIHGSGPAPWHYLAAIEAAQSVGRVAFIETSTRFAVAWAALLAVRGLLIVPPTGETHPGVSA